MNDYDHDSLQLLLIPFLLVPVRTTRTCDVRTELAGGLNSRATGWLYKVLGVGSVQCPCRALSKTCRTYSVVGVSSRPLTYYTMNLRDS
eukprot:5857441-Pyramimonas_sp.AAC.1